MAGTVQLFSSLTSASTSAASGAASSSSSMFASEDWAKYLTSGSVAGKQQDAYKMFVDPSSSASVSYSSSTNFYQLLAGNSSNTASSGSSAAASSGVYLYQQLAGDTTGASMSSGSANPSANFYQELAGDMNGSTMSSGTFPANKELYQVIEDNALTSPATSSADSSMTPEEKAKHLFEFSIAQNMMNNENQLRSIMGDTPFAGFDDG